MFFSFQLKLCYSDIMEFISILESKLRLGCKNAETREKLFI